MAWLKVGSKKLGVEFAYLAGSTIFIFLMHHNVIQPGFEQGGWENLLFYFIFFYNLITYLSLAFSDPGRIDPKNHSKYTQQLDSLVRLI
jgi:hypothetical protein